jgi:hypothetical protein
VLSLDVVPAVPKPTRRVAGSDGTQRPSHRLDQSLARARPRLAQDRLYLRERFFYMGLRSGE